MSRAYVQVCMDFHMVGSVETQEHNPLPNSLPTRFSCRAKVLAVERETVAVIRVQILPAHRSVIYPSHGPNTRDTSFVVQLSYLVVVPPEVRS